MVSTVKPGRVTPKGTRPPPCRRRKPITTTAHFPMRFPFPTAPDQRARRCTCGQARIGRRDEIDEWWDRHRAGLPEPTEEEKAEPKSAPRRWAGWARVAASKLRAAWSSRPKVTVRSIATETFDTLVLSGAVIRASFGRRASIINHDGELIELIGARRNGRPGWIDIKRGKWFPLVQGGAGTDRYWVGGTATWDATAGAKWAATDGGAGGASAPDAGDRVFFTALSGAVTVTTGTAVSLCRSLDCTGFTGTLTLANTSSAMSVGDASGGSFKLSAGMTLSMSATSTILFVSASTNGGVGWGITTAGKVMPGIAFNQPGKWTLQDALAATGGTATITLTAGTLDTNSQSVTTQVISSTNSNVRSLILGSSNITLTGGATSWNTSTSANLTIPANTAIITANGVSATFSAGGMNLNGASVVLSGVGTATVTGGSTMTCANLTRTGTSTKTDRLDIGPTTNLTVTGTLTLNSAGSGARLIVQSGSPGTTRTITAANVVITNTVDFMDIVGAGAATWTAAATGAMYLGDAGGNSGITFTPSTTQTRTGAGGNWSDLAAWTSRIPLPQDNVVIGAAATGTVNGDMPRLGGDINFTGFVGQLQETGTPSIYGSLTWGAGMTFNGANVYTLAGRASHTVTSNGKTSTFPLTFQGPGGTYALQDALSTTGALTINDGTFTTNNNSVSCLSLTAISARTTTLNLGTSTVSLAAGSGTPWNTNASQTTLNGASSSVVIATVSTNQRNVAWSAQGTGFGTAVYTIANSSGVVQIGNSGAARTLAGLTVGSGRSVMFFSGGTYTITNPNGWQVNGTINGYLYLPGVASNNVTVPDSAPLQLVGDLDLRAEIAADDYTPTNDPFIFGKWALVTSGGYYFRLLNSGVLRLGWANGATVTSMDSTVAVSTVVADGARSWVRVTLDVDNGSAQRVAKFYTSTNGSVWTQLGATVTTAGVATITTNTTNLEIGTFASGNNLAGKVYRVQVRSNILDNGTGIVLDADFTKKLVGANTFVESSVNAATVTINGALAQVGDGRVAITSSTPGSQATVSSATNQRSEYVTIQDSNAVGGGRWAAANSVLVSNDTGWVERTLVNDSADIQYPVRQVVRDTSDIRYPVRATSADSATVIYPVRAVVRDEADIEYPVRVPVADDVDIRYPVRVLAGDETDLRYPVRAVSGGEAELGYPVRTLGGNVADVRYPVRVVSGGGDVIVMYPVRVLAPAPLADLRYPVRSVVGYGAHLIWPLQGIDWTIKSGRLQRNDRTGRLRR